MSLFTKLGNYDSDEDLRYSQILAEEEAEEEEYLKKAEELENYDFEVIDLGKDVDPQAIADKVVETHAALVGLSALMTTTVVNMEATIKLLRQVAGWAKIMVGGAVLTQEYADMIGADKYAKDAIDTVHYAQEVFGK